MPQASTNHTFGHTKSSFWRMQRSPLYITLPKARPSVQCWSHCWETPGLRKDTQITLYFMRPQTNTLPQRLAVMLHHQLSLARRDVAIEDLQRGDIANHAFDRAKSYLRQLHCNRLSEYNQLSNISFTTFAANDCLCYELLCSRCSKLRPHYILNKFCYCLFE